MTRPLPLLAALCAVVLLVAGCTKDKPDPNYSSVTPTASTSTSQPPPTSTSPTDFPTTGPNVNPGEVAPTEPPGSDANSAEGAQAFETYYIKLVDWVYATSQPQILRPLYDTSCQNCTNFFSNLSGQVADGRTFKGSRISIQRLALVPNDKRSGASYAVSVEIAATALQILDRAGKVTDQGAASTLTLTNWLKWTGDSWQIVDQGKA